MATSEPQDVEEARETLRRIEERLRRDVGDMVAVLAADVPAQLVRAVRQVFERSERADRLDDAAVAALKEDTLSTSEALAREVSEQLSPFEVWRWDPSWPLPGAPDGLDAHPRVAEVLGRVGAATRDLLARHQLPPDELGELAGYKLPAYFVAGHFMKSLVANYWRALGDYEELTRRLADVDKADERRARVERWERA